MSSPPPENLWQPIDTAPDGEVLIYVRDQKDPSYLPYYPARVVGTPFVVQAHRIGEKWYDTGSRPLEESWSWVTHWMPLPPPPE